MYEPFDFTLAYINGLYYATNEILTIFNDHLIDNLNDFDYLYCNSLALRFLADYSCKDSYVMKKLIMNYILALVSKPELLNKFYTELINSSTCPNSLILCLIDSKHYIIFRLG